MLHHIHRRIRPRIRRRIRPRVLWGVWLLALGLAACAPRPVEPPESSAAGVTGGDSAESAPSPAASTPTAPPAQPSATPAPAEATTDDRPATLRNVTRGWNTNWALHSIDYSEILSGGPPRDGIPSIDDPEFITPDEAADWLADVEPVIALTINGDSRAYPLQILTWHEIVNDTVGGVPVIVTFCPLCNSAVVFERVLDGEPVTFGTSGLLRNSDLIMYDRKTESLWQQFTGEAIVGDKTGALLTFLPSSLISFADFRTAHPDGVVLSRNTGFNRNYGRNPYVGYDGLGNTPFLFTGVVDGRLPAMARVATVALGDSYVAYPYATLETLGVINDTQAGRDLVVFFQPGTASALGAAAIAEAEDVGATGVFDPAVDGQKLTFRVEDGATVDDQTGSRWNIRGQAVAGPLAGAQLTQLVSADHFWFSWAAFRPDTIIYEP